ncbi:hypothetical protein [Actinoplanes sp. HUAS TT8]|uniref:hypothetical protein n=1 Tax=Actinoplanes sp. HUAS TT8 TaxID=3447453 RepID=UPI003F528B63
MTSDEQTDLEQRRTTAAMHDTAEKLEVIEGRLHDIAERARGADTTARIHALGADVTAEAAAIDRRADLLDET